MYKRQIVRSVEDSMKRGTVVLKSPDESRNKHQSVTLLEAIEEFGFDCCIGGARRDEEKARAKERIMSFRDEFGPAVSYTHLDVYKRQDYYIAQRLHAVCRWLRILANPNVIKVVYSLYSIDYFML